MQLDVSFLFLLFQAAETTEVHRRAVYNVAVQ